MPAPITQPMTHPAIKALRLLVLSLLLVAAAACSRPVATTLAPEGGYPTPAADTRPRVADITALAMEPTPGGAILRVKAMADSPGWWDIALRRAPGDDDDPAERRFDLRGRPPVDATGARLPATGGPPALREIDAAVFLSDRDLDGVRRITVNGDSSSRTLRR